MKNERIHSLIAGRFIKELCLRNEPALSPQKIYKNNHLVIRKFVNRMNFETLGRLACLGQGYNNEQRRGTSLFEVHGNIPWLCEKSSGRGILRKVVETVIVAEIYDQLRRHNATVTPIRTGT